MNEPAEIPVHRLGSTPFYASYSEGVNLGDFESSHRIDFFAIIWFDTDAGHHYIDFNPYPVKKNWIYLLAPNQVHALPGKRPGAKVILFSRSFFEGIEEDELRLLFLPFYNEGIGIPDQLVEPLTHLFGLILLENQQNNELKLLTKYTSALLIHLHRLSDPDSRRVYRDERLRQLFQLITAHYKVHKLVDFYAGRIGLTSKRLNQIVKGKTGFSVSQLIYNYTLLEAKREICHSTKSLKEIAIELGFRGQSYFSRFFKKQTGMTPEAFRQQQL